MQQQSKEAHKPDTAPVGGARSTAGAAPRVSLIDRAAVLEEADAISHYAAPVDANADVKMRTRNAHQH